MTDSPSSIETREGCENHRQGGTIPGFGEGGRFLSTLVKLPRFSNRARVVVFQLTPGQRFERLTQRLIVPGQIFQGFKNDLYALETAPVSAV